MDSKIPHQPADWIRDDKAGKPHRPSEVFLELWQWRALDQSPEKFAECAAAWRQIVSLEEIYAEVRAKDMANRLAMQQARLVPAPVTFAEEDTSSGAEAPPSAPLSVGSADISPRRGESSPQGEGITYDCASAPMTEEAEAAWAAAEAEAKAREAANRSAGAKAGFATRKRNLTERLEDLRRRGVKMHEIAAAVNGLTITDVMDALQAKPMSPMKIQALEKACRKLEEADAGGGEDS